VPFERLFAGMPENLLCGFQVALLTGSCRSINQMKSGATQNQLLDLCDRLEAAERNGDGMLDKP